VKFKRILHNIPFADPYSLQVVGGIVSFKSITKAQFTFHSWASSKHTLCSEQGCGAGYQAILDGWSLEPGSKAFRWWSWRRSRNLTFCFQSDSPILWVKWTVQLLQWFLVFNGQNHFGAGDTNGRYLELETELGAWNLSFGSTFLILSDTSLLKLTALLKILRFISKLVAKPVQTYLLLGHNQNFLADRTHCCL